MNHSPAQILRKILTEGTDALFDQGMDASVWPLYVGLMPDGETVEDDLGTLTDTAGIKTGRISEGLSVFTYGVQLTIRSVRFEDGWQKAQAVQQYFETLSLTTNKTVELDSDSYTIWSVSQTSPVNVLGTDGTTKRRWLFTMNFLVHVSEGD